MKQGAFAIVSASHRLPGEQFDGCDEHEGCQDRDDQSSQPRLARLGAQMQNTLSPQSVGRQHRNEEGTVRWPVTQDRHQHQEPQAQSEHRLQQLCGDTARSHALIG